MYFLAGFLKRLSIGLFIVLLATVYAVRNGQPPVALLPAAAAVALVLLLFAWARRQKGGKRVKYRKYVDPAREMKRIANMDGHDFEYYAAQLLKHQGFKKISVTRGSGDYGVDILARKSGERYAVQCKNYRANIGVKAVQEAVAGREYYGCDRAMVIVTSMFTPQAVRMAESTDVELWDGEMIYRAVSRGE